MKKHKQTPRILTTFPSAKSRTNPTISSTFSLDAVQSFCSSSSTSSCSSRSHFPNNKLKSQSKPSLVAPTRSKLHSKENDFPNSTSRKLGNDKRRLLSRRPVSKPVQRSNLLADLSNSSSGSQQFRLNSENLKKGSDTCTPFGKGNKDIESDSGSGNSTSAKTPPIEASVSPEIQFGAAAVSKGFGNSTRAKTPPVEASVSPEIQFGAAAVSTGSTPVCYGTSHLLSGVKDKRKCRSKGILIIGDEIDVSVEEDDDDTSSNHKFTDSRPSIVPCPANAAMIWLSSPKKHDVVDNVSDAFGSLIVSGFESDGDHSDNKCIKLNDEKTRIVLPSSFDKLLGGSGGGEADMDLSSSSPSSLLSEIYSLSSSSLSCGNVVQTPTSDLSSDHKAVETCWLTDTNSHQRKLDLGEEIPDYNKREEERVSYVSDCTLASMSFTGLRISWRGGLGDQSFDRDEDDLDCCRCLSDEEEYDCHQTSFSQGVVTENPKPFGSVENEKEATFRAEPNVSAESICLDGDRLIASGDSDWTLPYKNHLFQV